jgi:membrane-associated protease RseP (regulator of RpoE activity)
MTEMARKGTRFLAIAAGTVVLGAAVVVATTGPAPRAEVSPAPAAAPMAVDYAVARPAPHPPEPPEPPEAPEAPEAPRARRAWLGIVLSGDGAEISSVADGSPAEEAGLKRGDRIVQINGKDVDDAGEVVEEIRSLEPGDTVKLRVERDGDERTVTATLAGRRGPGARAFHLRPGPAPFAWHGGEGQSFVFGGSRNYLGVEVHPMSSELREHFRAPRDAGLLVNRVVEDTPAAKAGLKAGDVIVEVDGEEIGRVGDISRALDDHEPGDSVDVKVMRDGSERTLKVELEERPEPRMKRRSFSVPRGDGDDNGFVIGFSEEDGENLRRAIEESMRGLHESLEALGENDDDRVIQLEIREQLRKERQKIREGARKAARQARFARHSFDI